MTNYYTFFLTPPQEPKAMTEKIEWYKEVLALEPSSRLFFPLARLLAEANRIDEALLFLQQGLERHPEFMEARLLYVELLHKQGATQACQDQISRLESLLGQYAGFWEAWGASRRNEPEAALADMGWVLQFLALNFGSKPVSLKKIMERGLNSFLADPAPVVAPPERAAQEPAPSVNEAVAMAQPVPPLQSPVVAESPLQARVSAAQSALAAAEAQTVAPIASATAQPPTVAAMASRVATMPRATAHEEGEVTVRTRSMADVLAEQGDVLGALEIYEELRGNAADARDAAALEQRISTLKACMEAPMPSEPESSGTSTGRDRLITMLEALAERVEARAQQG
jgi:tetratricopeptide (TPR) repeat protein